MKKFIKTTIKITANRKNLKFLSKKSASKYLIHFFKEIRTQKRFFYSKDIRYASQETLLDTIYRFVIKSQLSSQSSKKSYVTAQKVKICTLSGRVRGYIERFRLSRVAFRKTMTRALIPGERKSSF